MKKRVYVLLQSINDETIFIDLNFIKNSVYTHKQELLRKL